MMMSALLWLAWVPAQIIEVPATGFLFEGRPIQTRIHVSPSLRVIRNPDSTLADSWRVPIALARPEAWPFGGIDLLPPEPWESILARAEDFEFGPRPRSPGARCAPLPLVCHFWWIHPPSHDRPALIRQNVENPNAPPVDLRAVNFVEIRLREPVEVNSGSQPPATLVAWIRGLPGSSQLRLYFRGTQRNGNTVRFFRAFSESRHQPGFYQMVLDPQGLEFQELRLVKLRVVWPRHTSPPDLRTVIFSEFIASNTPIQRQIDGWLPHHPLVDHPEDPFQWKAVVRQAQPIATRHQGSPNDTTESFATRAIVLTNEGTLELRETDRPDWPVLEAVTQRELLSFEPPSAYALAGSMPTVRLQAEASDHNGHPISIVLPQGVIVPSSHNLAFWLQGSGVVSWHAVFRDHRGHLFEMMVPLSDDTLSEVRLVELPLQALTQPRRPLTHEASGFQLVGFLAAPRMGQPVDLRLEGLAALQAIPLPEY